MSLPGELSDYYGLTIEVLNGAFGCEGAFSWHLHGIPNVEFYRKLHCFLKNWITTRSLAKTSIGNFYISIEERGSSPYNTYRFIEQLVSSDIPDSALMSYGRCYEDTIMTPDALLYSMPVARSSIIINSNSTTNCQRQRTK